MNLDKLPEWAKKRIEPYLEEGENLESCAKGRVEINPPTGLGAMLFWIKYIVTNYFGIFISMMVRETAWMGVTNKRIIIVTNDGVNFPFWVLPFSRTQKDYILRKEKLASINSFEDRVFWVINSKGFMIESTGSLSIIFNGVNRESFESFKKIFRSWMN
jgi:hypothetical protein